MSTTALERRLDQLERENFRLMLETKGLTEEEWKEQCEREKHERYARQAEEQAAAAASQRKAENEQARARERAWLQACGVGDDVSGSLRRLLLSITNESAWRVFTPLVCSIANQPFDPNGKCGAQIAACWDKLNASTQDAIVAMLNQYRSLEQNCTSQW